MCSARATPSCQACCAAERRELRDRRDLGQCVRRVRGLTAALARQYPTFEELQFFLKNGSRRHALRKDEAINHIHWATTRRRDIPSLMAWPATTAYGWRRSSAGGGCDEDRGLQGAGGEGRGQGRQRPRRLRHADRRKTSAARRCSNSPGTASPGSAGRWNSRARGRCASNSPDVGSQLVEWPVDHCIKCLCFYHPNDPTELKKEQQDKLRACSRPREKSAGSCWWDRSRKARQPRRHRLFRALEELYALGVKPDWWKLEPQASPGASARIEAVIGKNDPWCHGVVLLGLDAPRTSWRRRSRRPPMRLLSRGSPSAARSFPMQKNGSAGSSTAAVADVARRFENLTEAWLAARGRKAA